MWIAGGHGTQPLRGRDRTFPRKVAALRAHESQTRQMDDLTGVLRTRLARMASEAGLPEGRLAEGFQVLDTG